jgi:predicted metal-dependent hydrolase
VPGLQPHPIRDAAGHSYEAQPRSKSHPGWTPDDWRELEAWLYGVDLFNQFFFWEAHEAWEGLWASTERGAAPSLVLQGLIQIAAALLKTHLGVLDGAQTLSTEGLNKLRRARTSYAILLGLDLDAVIGAFDRYFAPLQRDQLPAIDGSVPVLWLSKES